MDPHLGTTLTSDIYDLTERACEQANSHQLCILVNVFTA